MEEQIKNNWSGLFIVVGLMFGAFLILAYTGVQRSKLPIKKNDPSKKISSVTNQSYDVKSSSIKRILELKLPMNEQQEVDWQQYFYNIKDLKVSDKKGRISGHLNSSSNKVGLLAIMVEQAPQEFMRLVDSGDISQRIFNNYLRSGYLKDWQNYSDSPLKTMLKNSQALYSVARATTNIKKLKRSLIDYFMNNNEKLSIDVKSLAFSFSELKEGEEKDILRKLVSDQYNYDPRHIVVLERNDVFSKQELKQLTELKAFQSKVMSSYQFDVVKWGGNQYLNSMIKDIETNAKQPMNFYCAFCTLVAFTDGLVAQTLIDSERKSELEVVKEGGDWIFKLKAVNK